MPYNTAINVTFATAPQPDDPPGRVVYCLALEHAEHGDLGAFLDRTARGWPETTARREIAGILHVLGRLHRGQLLHRDLTPMNVFVCGGRRLKLGDFGIVRQQSDERGITARRCVSDRKHFFRVMRSSDLDRPRILSL